MSNKICLIKQPQGLGDILFCHKSAHRFIDLGYRIVWPIIPEYSYLPEYLIPNENIDFYLTTDDYPKKEFYEMKDFVKDKDFLFLPLNQASLLFPNPNDPYTVMASKFIVCDTTHDNWQDYFNFRRNAEREEVIWNHFKLQEGDEYIVVNRLFGSPPHSFEATLPRFEDKRVVEMTYFNDDRIFDWLKVIEHASEFHTVQTSIQALLEKVEIKAKTLKIYPRTGQHQDFSYAKPFYTKHEWEYVE
jgi:hypothetical protein